MANMFDTKEPVQQGDSNIIDDIIDVWSMDFSDPDTWLLRPSQDSTDDRIWDSHTWWKKNIDRGCNNSQENKRLIDTRTFTRPKKRSGRLSFESIGETSVSQPSNVWNPQFLENIGTKQTYSDDTEFTPSQQDHVPSMLRLSNPGVSSCMMQSPFISGHQSLESIRCNSQSKEIDTFVDLAKTESNEDIMEISQPSVFYSSIMSVTTDDVSADIERLSDVSRQFEIEDSQILTESMMEMSMFGDIYDINFNDTFAKNSAETTMLENITYCSPIDTTFLAGSVIKSKKTLDNTFNVTNFDRQTISDDTTWLNVPNAKPQNAMFNVDKFDATFDKTPDSSPTKSSNDFELKESVPLCNATMNLDDCILNKTFVAPCEKVDLVNEVETLRIDATFDKTIVLSPTESLNDYAPKESPLLKVSTKVSENIDPDLDDRLSVRSDGSNMSYTMGTTNIDQFQKIIHIQEECTGTNSSQRKIVAPRTISQTAVNQTRNPREYKTGIKPPSNWTSTDRPVSGIPRPRSRIPAPKFIRPSTKFNQGEKKK